MDLSFFKQYDWVIKIIILVLAAFVITWLVSRVCNKLAYSARIKHKTWRLVFLESALQPFNYFLWVYLLSVALGFVCDKFSIVGSLLGKIGVIQSLLLVVFMFWFVMRFIYQGEVEVLKAAKSSELKTNKDTTTINAVAQLTRVAVIVLLLLVLLQTLGIPIATLLAFGGIGGLAIGFAAKDTLANFLGGLMIYWDRPFSVGDWIRSPDRNVEGTVENIGWRLTQIRTFDKRPLYVPNGIFSMVAVENPSRMTNRRIRTTLGLRYEDAKHIGVVINDIDAMLRGHSGIDAEQTLFVKFTEFAGSSLNILVYTFTKTTDWVEFLEVQQDVFLKMVDIVTSHGADFAFPTSTIKIPEGVELKQFKGDK